MINGVTDLIMTKPDVLSGFPEIKICTHYSINGKQTSLMPFDIVNETITPVYMSMNSWETELTGISREKDFPKELGEYIAFLEKELNVPVTIVSVGPDRKQTIVRKKDDSFVHAG